jgi:hypothetical protein
MQAMSRRQESRQKHREQSGKYAKVNPCYHCGKSAGDDYCSDRRTDNEFNDEGLCLCRACCDFLDGLADEEALWRLKLANYGTNPQQRTAIGHPPMSSEWKEEYRASIQFHHAKNKKAHSHEYVSHPTLATHVTCRICGFAVTRAIAPKHLIVPATPITNQGNER